MSAGPKNVPYAQRHTAAWAQLSQRLAARQSVYLQFATVSLTATSALFGFMSAQTGGTARRVAEWGAAGLVAYTWALALWIRNNDAVIGLLGVFCGTLERLDDPSDQSAFPAWHTEAQGWLPRARHYRLYSDWAAIILALLSSLPAFSFGFSHYKNCEIWSASGLFCAGIVGIGAVVFLWYNRVVRNGIAKLTAVEMRANWGSPLKPTTSD